METVHQCYFIVEKECRNPCNCIYECVEKGKH